MTATETELYEVDFTEHEVEDLTTTAIHWAEARLESLDMLTVRLGPDHPRVVDLIGHLESMEDIAVRVGGHGAYTREEIQLLQEIAHFQIAQGALLRDYGVYAHGHLILDKLRKPVGGEDMSMTELLRDLSRQKDNKHK